LVRLTDIIKGDTEDPKDKGKPSGNNSPDPAPKEDAGYSMKNLMGDIRHASPLSPAKPPPRERGGLQLKGLLGRDGGEHESQKEEAEKKPAIPRGEIEKVYDTMLSYVKFIFAKAKRNEPFNLNDGVKIIDFIIKTPEALELLYGKAVTLKATEELLFTNFVNVSIYCMKMGIGMKYEPTKLLQLGIAGLVHDIGMARVPDHIVDQRRTTRLEGEEFEMLKRHTQFGAEIVQQLGPNYSWLVETIYHEHERENGNGYPQGLKGDQINEFARIIAVADVYDAMTSPRPHRKRFLPYEATKEIVQSQRGFYWPKAVKVLLTNLSAFPANSYVRLNNRAIARVVEPSQTAPLRPKVVILFDGKGVEQHGGKVMDLQQNPLLYIVGSLAPEDLPST